MAAQAIIELLLDIHRDEERERMERFRNFNELRLRRRFIRDTSNPFTLPPEYFQQYYR